jgi:hypothetical protein
MGRCCFAVTDSQVESYLPVDRTLKRTLRPKADKKLDVQKGYLEYFVQKRTDPLIGSGPTDIGSIRKLIDARSPFFKMLKMFCAVTHHIYVEEINFKKTTLDP